MSKRNNAPARFEDLMPFSPLEVKVEGSCNDSDFNNALRKFKSIVQKSQKLSLYKEKQSYEKPSDKKRRKAREADERRRIAELREKQIDSGEWDRKQKRKEQKRKEKLQKRRKGMEEDGLL
jgi:small subunit ribosomal protein S21